MKNSFDDKLAHSDPGDEIVYHKGFHCLATPDFIRRNPDAKAAWQAYERGDVLLYQRRMATDMLYYCAKVIR